MEPVKFTGQTGAGLYGGSHQTHKTACSQSNNPFGHNPACPCKRDDDPEPEAA